MSSSRLMATILVDDQLEEIQHVARIEGRGIGRHHRREVGVAHQRDAMLDDHAIGFRQWAVAALCGRQVDHHRARFHGLHGGFGQQRRRAAARDQRSGDDDVGLACACMHEFSLTAHPVGRHRAGIAADTLGDLAFFVRQERHVEEFGAQRFDLLLHGGAHVGGFDDRAQALGRGNRLQARHTGAEDQHTRRFDGAGGGHQHRHEALVVVRGHHHRLVAGNVGLRGEHVHALRARGARRGFQRERGDVGRSQARGVLVIKRVEHADQHGAGLHLRKLRRFR